MQGSQVLSKGKFHQADFFKVMDFHSNESLVHQLFLISYLFDTVDDTVYWILTRWLMTTAL